MFVGPPPASGDEAPATYSDPGFDCPHCTGDTEENFTASIDWGEGTVDVGVLTEVPGAEGVLTTGTVSGSHVYGDDGLYTVTVCVTDDNQAPNANPPVDGQTCDTFTVRVNNVNPVLNDPVFLNPAITFPSGDDAFLGRKGVEQTHGAEASDVGSDDLRYDWEFVPNPDRFGGALPSLPVTESTTTYNDGSLAASPGAFTDPPREEDVGPHPHGTFPFSSTDTVDVTFTGPGVYVDIIRFASSHFGVGAVVPLNNFQEANLILNGNKGNTGSGNGNGNGNGSVQPLGDTASNNKKKKKKGDSGSGSGAGDNNYTGSKASGEGNYNGSKASAGGDGEDVTAQANDNSGDESGTVTSIAKTREKAVRQTLAAWLNFAKGAVDLDEDIVIEPGESGSGVGDDAPKPPVTKTFEEIILEVEAILNNPDATKADLKLAKPESTEGVGRVSVLKRQEGAPLNLG